MSLRRTIRTSVLGFVVGAASCLLAFALLAAIGRIDVRATAPPGRIEKTLAQWTVRRARARLASSGPNPEGNVPHVLEIGRDHYRENCVICHGAPGVEPGELAEGLNPSAPALDRDATQALSDGALFWTIKYGIRMSGMPGFGPTHTDRELWALVAFVRHLPHLTDDEKASLREATDEHAHHGGGH